MKTHEELEVYFNAFVSSALEGGGSVVSFRARPIFLQRKVSRYSVYLPIGYEAGWGPRAGLNAVVTNRPFAYRNNEIDYVIMY
jgi:hypothetical protein